MSLGRFVAVARFAGQELEESGRSAGDDRPDDRGLKRKRCLLERLLQLIGRIFEYVLARAICPRLATSRQLNSQMNMKVAHACRSVNTKSNM